jgi:HCOMODA/2-hydroxy-3-carboxy-muconic semialdehyde decarboxylase
MSNLDALLKDLVIANRILAKEDVVDAYGHVAVRNPNNPKTFFLSRSLAPELIEKDDIMEFGMDGQPVDKNEKRSPYLERFIHAAIMEKYPDVNATVHAHAEDILPFGIASGTPLRPVIHSGSFIGPEVPVWDIADKFGDTNLLVTNMEMGRDLAKALDKRTVSLMRGHGCVVVGKSLREVVFTSVYLEVNADLQMKSIAMGGEITFLSDGEIDIITKGRAGFTLERGWENWCQRVGRPYVPQEMTMGEGYIRT